MSSEVDDLRARLEQVARERDSAQAIADVAARIADRINQYPLDVNGTLIAIAEAARDLTDADGARVWFREGDHLVPGPDSRGASSANVIGSRTGPLEISHPAPLPTSVRECRTVAVDDLRSLLLAHEDAGKWLQVSGELRSLMSTPLGKSDFPPGALIVYRGMARPFDALEQRTLEAFATQAAVAIEAARTRQQLSEHADALTLGLERETATGGILRSISENPGELAKVLSEIGAVAMRLCESEYVAIGFTRPGQGQQAHQWIWDNVNGLTPRPPDAESVSTDPDGQPFLMVCGPLNALEQRFPGSVRRARTMGLAEAAFLRVRMGGAGGAQGWMVLRRNTAREFVAREFSLLQGFADQALIAIKNAQVFTELQARNAEISVALERERATTEVLGVINRSQADLQPVLNRISELAGQLTGSTGSIILVMPSHLAMVSPWWNGMEMVSASLESPLVLPNPGPKPATLAEPRGSAVATAIRDGRTIHLHGGIAALEETWPGTAFGWRLGNYNSGVIVPLVLKEVRWGAIHVVREIPDPYTPEQIALLETFATQAAIAIENARLFNQLQTRNQEITEALRRQEAGSAILRQISESPEELDVTLQAITDAARRLTGCVASISLIEGEFRVVRGLSLTSEMSMRIRKETFRLNRHFQRAIETLNPVLWSHNDPLSPDDPQVQQWRADQITATAIVPIPRGDDVVGFLTLGSEQDEAIPPAAVTLLQAFADQAAIAIENARLIWELRESNRAISENLDVRRVMGEVLAIVASAPSNLRATLPKIVKAAAELTGSDLGAAAFWIEGSTLMIWTSVDDGLIEMPWDPQGSILTPAHRAIREAREVEWHGDIEAMRRDYPLVAQFAETKGSSESQSMLAVPMISTAGNLGALSTVRSNGLDEFSDRSRSVLRALATQAVVAIENARLFRQLQEKTEALEVASRHKSEFLANMSHELRTPLNAIIGYAELLQEECEDLGQHDFLPDLGKIHSAGKHLLNLISGILDLSKVEAGRMTMFLEDFDIRTLLRDADAIVRPLVEKNGNVFVIDCAEDIGGMHADLVKVRQVLFNLLSNAAKFTQNGRITMGVGRGDDDTIHMAITDTGIGMTEAQQERLFEAFSQASAETSRKYGGTGLGLALSREFCRMMGGDITVVSEQGRGSTFTVVLPRICMDMDRVS